MSSSARTSEPERNCGSSAIVKPSSTPSPRPPPAPASYRLEEDRACVTEQRTALWRQHRAMSGAVERD